MPLLESFATADTPSLSTCRTLLSSVFKDDESKYVNRTPKKREEDELDRLQQLIDHYKSSKCQAQLLSSYFRHEKDADFKCGYCQFCITGIPLPDSQEKTPVFSGKLIQETVASAIQQNLHTLLATDEFKPLVRFLLGNASQQVTKNKLKSNPLHSSLEGASFALVYRDLVKQLGGEDGMARKRKEIEEEGLNVKPTTQKRRKK